MNAVLQLFFLFFVRGGAIFGLQPSPNMSLGIRWNLCAPYDPSFFLKKKIPPRRAKSNTQLRYILQKKTGVHVCSRVYPRCDCRFMFLYNLGRSNPLTRLGRGGHAEGG